MSIWENNTAIVTGGGSGIGRALVHELVKRGAIVTIADINIVAAEHVASEYGGPTLAIKLEVRDAKEFRNCINSIIMKNGKLDFLFDNAGIGLAGETFDISITAWEKIIGVDIKS